MRVLLLCLLACLGTAAGKCMTTQYTDCLWMRNVTSTCSSVEVYSGEMLCACDAHVGECARQYGCADECVATMASKGCGADWCNMVNVTKPTKVVAVYRFTQKQKLSSSAVHDLMRTLAGTESGFDYTVTDLSAANPTLPPGVSPSQIELLCSQMKYKFDCEKTFGYCKWNGAECDSAGKSSGPAPVPVPGPAPVPVPGPAPVPVPGPVPAPIDTSDVRPIVCAHMGQLDKCLDLKKECTTSKDGKCIANPNGFPVPAALVCPTITNEKKCHVVFGICLWKSGRCVVNSGPIPGEPDVRPMMCSHPEACVEKQTMKFCKKVNGVCAPNPDGTPVPALMVCPVLERYACMDPDVPFCDWIDGRCTIYGGTSRGGAVLSGGTNARNAVVLAAEEAFVTSRAADTLSGEATWQLTAGVEFTHMFINKPLVEVLRQQMDVAATSKYWTKHGASLYKAAVVVKAGEGEPTKNGGGSSGPGGGNAVGIAFGVLAGVALVGVVGFLVIKHRQQEGIGMQLDTDDVDFTENSISDDDGEDAAAEREDVSKVADV